MILLKLFVKMLLNGLLIPKYQLIRTEGLESKVLMAGDDITTIEIAFNTKVQSEKIKDVIEKEIIYTIVDYEDKVIKSYNTIYD